MNFEGDLLGADYCLKYGLLYMVGISATRRVWLSCPFLHGMSTAGGGMSICLIDFSWGDGVLVGNILRVRESLPDHQYYW